VIGFVRLVDKAVQEYEAARGMLDSYLSTRPRTFSFILRAVGHMEPCLNAVARAVRFVDALRSSRGGPRIPKNLSCLSSSAKGRIQGIRDAVEHMEERVLTDRIVSGEPVALVLEDGHVELATERISFVELSTWLKQLNNLAVTLASTPEFRHHDA
jgi:hypothetical protein